MLIGLVAAAVRGAFWLAFAIGVGVELVARLAAVTVVLLLLVRVIAAVSALKLRGRDGGQCVQLRVTTAPRAPPARA